MDKEFTTLLLSLIILFAIYNFIKTKIEDRKEAEAEKLREVELAAAQRRYEKCGEFGSKEYWEVMTPIFKDIKDIFYQFTTTKETREKNESLKAIMEKIKE